MKTSKDRTVTELTRDIINNVALDFIVNEKDKKQIALENNLSENTMNVLIQRLNLSKKRDKYREKVLDKSLERCSTYQSKIIYKATEILHNHVETLSQKTREQGKVMLSSAEIRDVMAILQIISKEHRLDNDKPTDRTIKEVRVSFPEGYTPITQKPDVIVEAEFKDIKEEPKEEKVEVVVEIDDDILESPLG